MDMQQIEALARLIQQSDLTALEVSEGAVRIRLERERTAAAEMTAAVAAPPVVMPVQEAQPDPSPAVDFNHITEIKSPMVGVFYAAPAPVSYTHLDVYKRQP